MDDFPFAEENLNDLSLQKGDFWVEKNRRPAIGPAVVDLLTVYAAELIRTPITWSWNAFFMMNSWSRSQQREILPMVDETLCYVKIFLGLECWNTADMMDYSRNQLGTSCAIEIAPDFSGVIYHLGSILDNFIFNMFLIILSFLVLRILMSCNNHEIGENGWG